MTKDDFITPWLARLPFPVSEEIGKHKSDIIEWAKTPERQRGGFDRYHNKELEDYLYPLWLALLQENFESLPAMSREKFKINIIVQSGDWCQGENNAISVRTYHNHMKASINTVCYCDPPNTPTLEIPDPDNTGLEDGCSVKQVTVEENFLYMMPNWLHHRLIRQKNPTPRIAVNMEYYAEGFVVRPKIEKYEKFERPPIPYGIRGHNNIWSSSWNVDM